MILFEYVMLPHNCCMSRAASDLFVSIQDWCDRSVLGKDHGTFKDRAPDRRRNFLCVASRTSSAHLLYSRDLVSLLNLSHELGDSDLELDIGTAQEVRVILMRSERCLTLKSFFG